MPRVNPAQETTNDERTTTNEPLASQLYGVAPQDPLTLAFAIGLLLFVALSAVDLPARRASRLDRMTALRQE